MGRNCNLNTIKHGKNKVVTRQRGKPLTEQQMKEVRQTYIEQPRLLRRSMRDQWSTLLDEGMALTAVADVFGVGIGTVRYAIDNPKEWELNGTGKGPTAAAVASRDTRARRKP